MSKTDKKCQFDKAWVGMCNKPTKYPFIYCEEHIGLKCCVCGKQATHTCPETMSLVCGFPLCDDPNCEKVHDKRAHE